ncbi:Gfo/Idh/MocA family oxidoreductase [Bacillus thuringiensis]|uniref:Gfo/Idh/MocA family oxidoreductase n=1 Tax=Bacillus thuringiensis TaxID=1428 RepID=UPI00103E1ABE|nr:Gfo/Idh/MocA family oxidoreductase [Bacillus thuringiensis]TBX45810.1 hypothetical protein E0M35_09385 [Bacillus thuringiensis]
MNIGIIGADSIAKAHSRALSTIDNCKLVGVYDVNYENARELVKDYDGEVFNSYEELLEVVDGLEKQEIFLPLPLLVDPENEIFEWADSFRKEIISWVNAAGGFKKSLATFEDGLRSQIILDLFFNKNKRNKELSVTTI